MSTPCPTCGTLLLGKVNRCWKCGTSVEEAVAVPAVEKFPTIRPGAQLVQPTLATATYDAEESLVALPVNETPADGEGAPATAVASAGSNGSAGVAADAPAEPERVGSPFAAGPSRTANAARSTSSGASPASVPAPKYAAESPGATLERATRQQVSRAGAYGVWALATLALAGMFFTSIGAACVAFLGLTFGLWGLYSDRKALALGGAALCLALFLFSGFFAATDLYIHAFGRSPWSPPPAPSAGP